MNQAEQYILKKSLDAQIAKIKLPVEVGKIIKKVTPAKPNVTEKATKKLTLVKDNSYKDIKFLSKGQIVKFSNKRERFWVVVNKIGKNIISGTIDNKLLNAHNGKNYGDTIKFSLANICGIYKS